MCVCVCVCAHTSEDLLACLYERVSVYIFLYWSQTTTVRGLLKFFFKKIQLI